MLGDDWPAIRAPLRAGWDGASPDGVRVTPMEQGPAKMRTESTAVGAVERLPHKLSAADAALLEAHYAANKAKRFNFPHPIWGAVVARYARAPRWGQDSLWTLATVELEIFR